MYLPTPRLLPAESWLQKGKNLLGKPVLAGQGQIQGKKGASPPGKASGLLVKGDDEGHQPQAEQR